MKIFKLRKGYPFIYYFNVFVAALIINLGIRFTSINPFYYLYNVIILILIIVSFIHFKAHISIDDSKVIRDGGFKSFGKIVCYYEDIEQIVFRPRFKKIIIHIKENNILVINNFFVDLKTIGKMIYENVKKKDINVKFSEDYLHYFLHQN